MATAEDDDIALDGLFTEPPRPPSPEPTVFTYTRPPNSQRPLHTESHPKVPSDLASSNWSRLEIKLVGSHPLWGHHLWNAAKAFAAYLDQNPRLYANRNVLELGAGGGLPGIVTALNGARKVVLTDYPDKSLLDNLAENVRTNVMPVLPQVASVQGYIWGNPVTSLLEALAPNPNLDQKFDLIILSDLIFNHSQHEALLRTCDSTLTAAVADTSEEPCILVFYSHHRPHLAQRDLEFFSRSEARGWTCVKILTERFPPMFPEDPGDEEVRSTVHGWMLTRVLGSEGA